MWITRLLKGRSKHSRSVSYVGYQDCGAPVLNDKLCTIQVNESYTCYYHPHWREKQEEEESYDTESRLQVEELQSSSLSERWRSARSEKLATKKFGGNFQFKEFPSD